MTLLGVWLDLASSVAAEASRAAPGPPPPPGAAPPAPPPPVLPSSLPHSFSQTNRFLCSLEQPSGWTSCKNKHAAADWRAAGCFLGSACAQNSRPQWVPWLEPREGKVGPSLPCLGVGQPCSLGSLYKGGPQRFLAGSACAPSPLTGCDCLRPNLERKYLEKGLSWAESALAALGVVLGLPPETSPGCPEWATQAVVEWWTLPKSVDREDSL